MLMRICVMGSLLWRLALGVACGEEPVRPRGLQITPNALQDSAQPMHLRVQAGPRQPLWVLVLRDCDRDGSQPELTSRAGCVTPLRSRRVYTEDSGLYEGEQELGEVPGQPSLPVGEALWLRVTAVQSGERLFDDVIFALRDPKRGRCEAWRGVLAAFGLGPCRLGLERVFNPVRGSSRERPLAVFQVLRLEPRSEPLTRQIVPGTQGATGVSWDGPTALLLTLGPAAGQAAGLYRLELLNGRKTRLLSAPAEGTLAAPLSLGGGRAAVLEELEDRPPTLLILRGGQVSKRLALSRTVHQLLAADATGRRLLASSYSSGELELFTIDLATEAEVGVGDRALIAAALASRRDGVIAYAFPDAAGPAGWELVLLTPQGVFARGLDQGPGHALLPAWHPNGGELVYLGQVGASR